MTSARNNYINSSIKYHEDNLEISMDKKLSCRGGITVNHELCISCNKCYDACPTDTFTIDEKTGLVTQEYPEECWYCGACIYECPVEGTLHMELPLACL